MKIAADQELLEKIAEGFRRVGLMFPYLAGLIESIQVVLDTRVETMGVFASGRLSVNPEFAHKLSPRDLTFVLTHELYHLMLRTHQRGEGTDPLRFNFAHDYIINDILRDEMQFSAIPAGGLDWPGARHLSAEKIMGDIQHSPYPPSQAWDKNLAGGGGGRGYWPPPPNPGQDPSGDTLSGDTPAGDVLDSVLERKWFPDAHAAEQEGRVRAVSEQAGKAMGLKALMGTLRGDKGSEAGGQDNAVTALRENYRPPWELALQRWLDSVSPSERSYARPSRRGADRTDVVLPGSKRQGWSLHIVLDTSGSMIGEIPRALGAIGDFCAAVGVDQVHLLQCDTQVGRDEVLAPAEIGQWQVTGYGGSDLGPAMLRLADNPEVSAAIVLTDGDIDYPQQPVPYNVLWVLPAWKNPQDFRPSYGRVITLAHA